MNLKVSVFGGRFLRKGDKMNPIITSVAVFLGVLLYSISPSFAQSVKTFTLSASVPPATSIAINAFSVNSTGTPIFTAVNGLALSFGSLTFNATNGIYLPDHYFVVDLASQGGAGTPNVTLTYTEGANPNSSTGGNGLGKKATATFVKVAGTTETGLTGHGPKKLLSDLSSGENIAASEITGGFLRVYLGIVTGDPNASFPDPSGAEVFSNADSGGTYDGTLLVSATLP